MVMSKSKHTPGPWQVRTDLDGKPKLDSRNGYAVERADPTAGKPFVVSTWSLPNAHLIAAAPDMLEALRLALYAVTEIDNSHKSLRQIRAAITKAEGRT